MTPYEKMHARMPRHKRIYWNMRHRVHFWRHRDQHIRSCKCYGTGKL